MKNRSRLFIFLLLPIWFSCNKDNDCNGTVAITQVLPNSNPPGAEVRIIGDGLTANSTIRFSGQIAKSTFTKEKGLTAIVPNNINGLVDLTVEEGDCLVRTEFEVLGTLPANWIASSTVIVIPTFPPTFPDNISNVWKNYYDNDHTFFFSQFNSCTFSTAQQNLDVSSEEQHVKNKFLNKNPITGVYKCGTGTLDITIDRTKNGGTIEALRGLVIRPESIGISSSDAGGKKFMLFTSSSSRQYVFFVE